MLLALAQSLHGLCLCMGTPLTHLNHIKSVIAMRESILKGRIEFVEKKWPNALAMFFFLKNDTQMALLENISLKMKFVCT